jgi:hypothetical protein
MVRFAAEANGTTAPAVVLARDARRVEAPGVAAMVEAVQV